MKHVKLFESWLNEAVDSAKKDFIESIWDICIFGLDGETDTLIGTVFLLGIGLGDLTDYGGSDDDMEQIKSAVHNLVESADEETLESMTMTEDEMVSKILDASSKLSDMDKTQIFKDFSAIYCKDPRNQCTQSDFDRFLEMGNSNNGVNERWFGDSGVLEDLYVMYGGSASYGE